MNYFDSNKKKDCNGCGLCALKCPKKAISMKEDEEGFLYPIIDKSKCINCNLCKKICPNIDYNQNNNTICCIAINNNRDDLLNSSSGGCFIAIAKWIILKGGYVFGAAYDENLLVYHKGTNKISELKQFQGSKYMRSNLGNCFEKIKELLEENRYVLFSGTPCQCQALRSFLTKEYIKLFTCEIICHANPSPKVFDLYKKNLEKDRKKTIIDIKFRAKENGWKNQKPIIVYNDNSFEEENTFYLGFVRELFNRPSCHYCHFCTKNRLSDFTIGDAWGIEKMCPEIIDKDSGISLICFNTKKAINLKKQLENDLNMNEINKDMAFSYNHCKNVPEHFNRKKFFDGIKEGTINENNIIYNIKEYTKLSIYSRIVNKIRNVLK